MNFSEPQDLSPVGWNFDNSFTLLPSSLFVRQAPQPVRNPEWAILNEVLARELGLAPESLLQADGASFFTGNKVPPGSAPIAQAYAGHQYAHFTMLGDGRAVLLGEQIAPDGRRWDIHLKGSGQTPFSRRGDGRAALGPMLREYIISEAMKSLGIPTSRSLGVVATGQSVQRETILPGAVLVRIASSHIRVGTFEYAAACEDGLALPALAEYTLKRHFPDLVDADNCYVAMLEEIAERQASLIAKWMLVGFVHGVMNTDNMAVSGETIDYGPCAFMDSYDPATVFSSIDRTGRYSYGNQPKIASWNLARLAEAFLPLLDKDEKKALNIANEILEKFPSRFQHYWLSGMRAKLGLFSAEDGDIAFMETLLNWMKETKADYTRTFRSLAGGPSSKFFPNHAPELNEWHEIWKSRLRIQPQALEEAIRLMMEGNPGIIPRNHLVEEALQEVEQKHNFSPLLRLLEVLKHPFAEQGTTNIARKYSELPPPKLANYQTFCGT